MQEAPWAVLRLQPLASSVCLVSRPSTALLLGWVVEGDGTYYYYCLLLLFGWVQDVLCSST